MKALVSSSSDRVLRVVIVRDRAGCGGGIHALFEALRPYLEADVKWVDVGKPHSYYGGARASWWQRSRLRWVLDGAALVLTILRHKPALVHLNSGLDKEERSLKRDAINLWIARALGCPMLVQWHGWDHPAAGTAEFPGGNDGWLCRSYRKAARHVVLANAFREDLRRWGFDGIHLGSTVVPEDVLQKADVRVEKSFPPQVLFLSRVERAKGLWELLKAYSILKRRNVCCGLTIAGDGPDLEALKSHAVKLGLDEVSFPGFLNGDAKIACFQSAAIFCFPSHSEGMPLAVLEAMAMGLSVVATPAGGLADILQDGVQGFLVPLLPPDAHASRVSPEALADQIEKLILKPELRLKMGDANREEASQRFAPEVVAKKLEGIYREVLRLALN